MFKKILIGILSTLIISYPVVAYGQSYDFNIPIDIPDHIPKVIGLEKGDVVPEDGILFPTETTIYFFVELEKKIKDLENKALFLKEICEEACSYRIEILENMIEEQAKEHEILLRSEKERGQKCENLLLEGESNIKWYWILTGGILTGAAITATTFYLVSIYK